ncbi:Six-hairpin glycosidase-like protein [Aspergillus cavernicola]|uniref:Six-hairpin glycosidase-like protein n=1 Tax=Aspergillus cavernicola TaxID=176166 RepID=A0ABR4I7J4_9EURO
MVHQPNNPPQLHARNLRRLPLLRTKPIRNGLAAPNPFSATRFPAMIGSLGNVSPSLLLVGAPVMGLLRRIIRRRFRGSVFRCFHCFGFLMLYDHGMYFGDVGFLRKFLGAVDAVLEYFASRVDARVGMVGRFDSGSGNGGGDVWAFVDWTKEWSDPGPEKDFKNLAVPMAYRRGGVAAYNSLVYAYVLRKAAEMCEFVGRVGMAEEYRGRAGALNEAFVGSCLRRDGGDEEFFVDGPDSPDTERSQHVQVFAVLCGAVSGERARRILRRALSPGSREGYVRASYAMSFYVFEAAVQTGLYDELRDVLVQPWDEMVVMDLTTWAESVAMPRSDCHGWSAVPIYDVVANVVGLRPGGPGYRRIRSEPRQGGWQCFEGVFRVGGGEVKVSWVKGGGATLVTGFDGEVEVRDGEGYKVVEVKKGEVLTLS